MYDYSFSKTAFISSSVSGRMLVAVGGLYDEPDTDEKQLITDEKHCHRSESVNKKLTELRGPMQWNRLDEARQLLSQLQ